MSRSWRTEWDHVWRQPPPSDATADGPIWGAHLRASSDALLLSGIDGRDLLQRIVATALEEDSPERCQSVLFTTAKGKTVDVAVLAGLRDRGILVLAGESRRESLRSWIERWIITEDLELTPIDGVVLDLVGTKSLECAAQALGLAPPAPAGAAHGEGGTLLLCPEGPPPALAHLLLPGPIARRGPRGLLETGLRLLSGPEMERWAVGAGHLPAGDALISSGNPLEMGLRALVDFDKGCYIGQEVVARLNTYQKLRRRLVRIEGISREMPPAPGDDLRRDGRRVGIVLRIAPASTGQAATALAIVDHIVEAGETLAWGRVLPVEPE